MIERITIPPIARPMVVDVGVLELQSVESIEDVQDA